MKCVSELYSSAQLYFTLTVRVKTNRFRHNHPRNKALVHGAGKQPKTVDRDLKTLCVTL
jgi:hypothetical protein